MFTEDESINDAPQSWEFEVFSGIGGIVEGSVGTSLVRLTKTSSPDLT
jgi:hypothetical protein